MTYKNFRSLPLLVLLVVLLSACTVKQSYHQLDWVLAGMVDDYVTLSEEQEFALDTHITALLKWHRGTQLSMYVTDLRQLQQYTSHALTASEVEDISNRIVRSWQAIKQRVAPDMAETLLSLSASQQAELFENIREQNQKLDDEYKEYTQQERWQRAGDKLIEKFEDWLGELTDQQKAMLRAWPPKYKPLYSQRMAFRMKWQAALKQVLESTQPIDEKRQRLIDMITTPDTFRTAKYRQELADNIALTKQLMIEFVKTFTKSQRSFLTERLQQLITSLSELAAEKS